MPVTLAARSAAAPWGRPGSQPVESPRKPSTTSA